MAKLTLPARERSKGQIPVASGRGLESHCRSGVRAHCLPARIVIRTCDILVLWGVNSWVKHLGILDPMEASSAKSYVKSLRKVEDQLPDLFLFPVASWRAGTALFRTEKTVRGKRGKAGGQQSGDAIDGPWRWPHQQPSRPTSLEPASLSAKLKSSWVVFLKAHCLKERNHRVRWWRGMILLAGWWTTALGWRGSNHTARSQKKRSRKTTRLKSKEPPNCGKTISGWLTLNVQINSGTLPWFVLFICIIYLFIT